MTTESLLIAPNGDGSHDGVRGALGSLFPAAPAAAVRMSWGWRVLIVVAEVVAVGVGALVLLLRVPGDPSWDTMYAEDSFQYLPWALEHPWRLFVAFEGYLELVPRLVAQFVAFLPLADAAKGFAVSGAVIAAALALFIFHASAGHIRSVTLRALLATGVILLSTAPMEIADSGVDTLWYLLLALSWAVLWRPRTGTGVAVAALVGFFAAASTILVILFTPLLAIRLFVLRRPREHGVTAGALAGCLVQGCFVAESAFSGGRRLMGDGGPAFGRDNRLGNALSFYLHDVVLRWPGWRLSCWLEALTTRNAATLIAGAALAVILGAIIATQPGARPFIIMAMTMGFVLVMVAVFFDPWDAVFPVTAEKEVAARYTALPIMLIEASFLIGVDHALRRRRANSMRHAAGRRGVVTELCPALAAIALAMFLIVNWAADFRYYGIRSGPAAHRWAPVAAEWHKACEASLAGEISATLARHQFPIPCGHIRFLRHAPALVLVFLGGRRRWLVTGHPHPSEPHRAPHAPHRSWTRPPAQRRATGRRLHRDGRPGRTRRPVARRRARPRCRVPHGVLGLSAVTALALVPSVLLTVVLRGLGAAPARGARPGRSGR